ncbi:MAG: chemotaxis protein CheW [Gammaproteobacteria bacterium]|nr:chemotaxis protein CheW [Gammaproteobacteria bacterium]
MAQTKAWLLPLDGTCKAAVGGNSMVEFLVSADINIMPVPMAPVYSPGVILWRDRIIPVIDLASVLNPAATSLVDMAGVMVLAYQAAPGEPIQNGAVVLRAAPANIMVSSDMACPVPNTPVAWKSLAMACVKDGERVVPILNVRHVFSSMLKQLYASALSVSSKDHHARPDQEVSFAAQSPADVEIAETGSVETAAHYNNEPVQEVSLAAQSPADFEPVEAGNVESADHHTEPDQEALLVEQSPTDVELAATVSVEAAENIPVTGTDESAGRGTSFLEQALARQARDREQQPGFNEKTDDFPKHEIVEPDAWTTIQNKERGGNFNSFDDIALPDDAVPAMDDDDFPTPISLAETMAGIDDPLASLEAYRESIVGSGGLLADEVNLGEPIESGLTDAAVLPGTEVVDSDPAIFQDTEQDFLLSDEEPLFLLSDEEVEAQMRDQSTDHVEIDPDLPRETGATMQPSDPGNQDHDWRQRFNEGKV